VIIPKDGKNLVRWTQELIDECTVSVERRRQEYSTWKQLFYTGSTTGTPSKHNRCYSHIDKLSSFIFSPTDVRFDLECESDDEKQWTERLDVAARYLNRQFVRQKCDLAFSEAVLWSLIKGSTIIKQVWGRGGLEPWVIQPEFFGVLREDIPSLDRQDAFVHTFYLTPTQFRRLLGERPDKEEILRQATAGFAPTDSEVTGESYGADMVTAGSASIPGILLPGQQGQQQRGAVDWITNPAGPMLAQGVANQLIRVDDLWVMDDDREDWTTIRYVAPDLIIEGRYRRRNLSDIPGSHPFVRVCSSEVPNYFWGRSELANVYENQKLLTARVNNLDAMFNLIAKPARSFRGFSGLTEDKARALLSPGGILTDPSPTGEIKDLAPTIPPGAMEYINTLDSWFNEAAGFTAIMQGQGEPGVRAGSHADTLLRTSSPRLRTRALIVEKQVADFGEICLKMLQTKDARILMAGTDNAFLLDTLPEDLEVTVDSHTSSPAFSGDNANMAMALKRAGAIDDETLIEMMHPPRQDRLVARVKAREDAQSQQMQELKKLDPEQWAKAVSGGGRKR
jgi:hypothetical protein